MTYQFPNTPTVGQTVIGPTGVPYTWDGEKWVTAASGSANLFLPVTGGTMTGPLSLVGDANQALQPTTLEQMSAADTTLQNNINAIWGSGGLVGGFVNKIRNPGMDIWQRGAVTMAANTWGYTADGWIVNPTGAACPVTNPGRLAGAISGNSIRLAAASGLTSNVLQHRIESFVSAQIAGQTCTFRAFVQNNTVAPLTLQLGGYYPSGANDTWSSSIADLNLTNLQPVPANSSAIVAITFPVSLNANGGYLLNLLFGNALNATTGNVAITDVDFRATPGAPLGLNSNPPPVELRPFAVELVNCQRYYEMANSPYYFFIYAPATGVQTVGSIVFKVTKRVAPTGTYTIVSGSFSAPTMPGATVAAMTLTATTSATGAVFANISWTASAEL